MDTRTDTEYVSQTINLTGMTITQIGGARFTRPTTSQYKYSVSGRIPRYCHAYHARACALNNARQAKGRGAERAQQRREFFETHIRPLGGPDGTREFRWADLHLDLSRSYIASRLNQLVNDGLLERANTSRRRRYRIAEAHR